MSEDKKHTPLPWYADIDEEFGCRISNHAVYYDVLATLAMRPADRAYEEMYANAEFIAKAVNNFYPMLEFIRSLTDATGEYPYLDGKSVVADAYDILAKAERV